MPRHKKRRGKNRVFSLFLERIPLPPCHHWEVELSEALDSELELALDAALEEDDVLEDSLPELEDEEESPLSLDSVPASSGKGVPSSRKAPSANKAT